MLGVYSRYSLLTISKTALSLVLLYRLSLARQGTDLGAERLRVWGFRDLGFRDSGFRV